MVYGNRHEEDILLRKQIEEKVLDFPDRLAVFFTLSQPSASWKGFSGRINQGKKFNLITDHLTPTLSGFQI